MYILFEIGLLFMRLVRRWNKEADDAFVKEGNIGDE
jgi:hypothetical protein